MTLDAKGMDTDEEPKKASVDTDSEDEPLMNIKTKLENKKDDEKRTGKTPKKQNAKTKVKNDEKDKSISLTGSDEEDEEKQERKAKKKTEEMDESISLKSEDDDEEEVEEKPDKESEKKDKSKFFF